MKPSQLRRRMPTTTKPSNLRRMMPPSKTRMGKVTISDDLTDFSWVVVKFQPCGHGRQTLARSIHLHNNGVALRCLSCGAPRPFKVVG